ncbi:hypothetical protein F4804DRAFT_318595 [Jackrogersella minutella]|nr:hypothetical protein F4804DRAFT_318595 [Jackrogersella minutella]
MASQGHFTTLFHHNDVMLHASTLENMVHMTSQGRLGCQLRYCTITGISGMNVTAASNVDKHIRLFTEASLNRKQRFPKARLASLCLRVIARIQDSDGGLHEPETFRAWRDIWATALHVFNVTILALNESHALMDEYLDIFGGITDCSLMYDAFLSLSEKFLSMDSFRPLKKLTLSLSSLYLIHDDRNVQQQAPVGTIIELWRDI